MPDPADNNLATDEKDVTGSSEHEGGPNTPEQPEQPEQTANGTPAVENENGKTQMDVVDEKEDGNDDDGSGKSEDKNTTPVPDEENEPSLLSNLQSIDKVTNVHVEDAVPTSAVVIAGSSNEGTSPRQGDQKIDDVDTGKALSEEDDAAIKGAACSSSDSQAAADGLQAQGSGQEESVSNENQVAVEGNQKKRSTNEATLQQAPISDDAQSNTKNDEKTELGATNFSGAGQQQKPISDLEEGKDDSRQIHQHNSDEKDGNGLDDKESEQNSISNVVASAGSSVGLRLDQQQTEPTGSGIEMGETNSGLAKLENKQEIIGGASDTKTNDDKSDNEKQIKSNACDGESESENGNQKARICNDMSIDKQDRKVDPGSVKEINMAMGTKVEHYRNENKKLPDGQTDEKYKITDEANQITDNGDDGRNETAVHSGSKIPGNRDEKSESEGQGQKIIPDGADRNFGKVEHADPVDQVSDDIKGHGNEQPDDKVADVEGEGKSSVDRISIESNDKDKESGDIFQQLSNDTKNDESKSAAQVAIHDKKFESVSGGKDEASDDEENPSKKKEPTEPPSVKGKEVNDNSDRSKENDKDTQKEEQSRPAQEQTSTSKNAKARMLRVSVTIPHDKKPGESFLFKNPAVQGQLLKVVVPSTGKAGGVLFVNVPAGRVDLPSSTLSASKDAEKPREAKEHQSSGKSDDKEKKAQGESSKKLVEPPKGTSGNMLKVSVIVPADKNPGDSFFFKNPAVATQLLKVVVPSNGKPGGLLFVNVPTSVPASANNSSKPTAKMQLKASKDPTSKRPAAQQNFSKQSESSKKAKAGKCKVSVKIPKNKKPGQSFTFQNPSIPSQLLRVVVPPTGKPGGTLFVNVPSKKLSSKGAAKNYSRLALSGSKSQQQFLMQAPMHQLFMPTAAAPYTATLNKGPISRNTAYSKYTSRKHQIKQPVKKAATSAKPSLSKRVAVNDPLLLSGKTEICLCGRQNQCISIMNRFYALGKNERVGYFGVPTLSQAQMDKSGRKGKLRACVIKHIFGARDRIAKGEGKRRQCVLAKWHFQPGILKLCTKVAGDTVLPEAISADLAKELKIHGKSKNPI